MPEAPDVDVVAKYLRDYFLNATVLSCRCRDGHDYAKDLVGFTLKETGVHGKSLLCTWEKNGEFLYSKVHFALAGRLYDGSKHGQEIGHYFTLYFETGNVAVYDHMGVAAMSLQETPFVNSGVCVMSGAVTIQDLRAQCGKRKGCIAGRLLAQERIVGIGHIACNEILAEAGIHPKTSCAKLTENQMKKLVDACNTVPKNMSHCGGWRHHRPVIPDGTQGFYMPLTYGLKEDDIETTSACGKVFYTRVPLDL